TANAAERRMALRLSQQRLRLVGDAHPGDDQPVQVAVLPTVARVTAISGGADTDGWPDRVALPAIDVTDAAGLGGDDDDEAECDAAMPTDAAGPDETSDEEFYADVMDSA